MNFPMLKFLHFILLLLIPIFFGCSKSDSSDPVSNDKMYFPSNNSSWEKQTISALGWNQNAFQDLKIFLEEKHTKSFMILVNGRIVVEEYFNGHTSGSTWPWNSAGKTLVASVVGIAQQEELLSIDNKVSRYLGEGWTSETLEQENLVTLRHLLSMTSGINDEKELIIKSNLTYVADAGTRWSYHNVFQKLMDVVGVTANQDFENYFNAKLKNKIGMDGFWDNGLIFRIYNSNTRSMARFGLLALNNGNWNNELVLNETFFNESINTSQNINPSYGYLWWLNGKTGFMIPGSQTFFQGSLVPNAPSDMYSAMGAADQRIYIVPGKKMVIVRMGEASNPADPNFAVSGFDNDLWEKINAVIN